jgi:hypothetical protein
VPATVERRLVRAPQALGAFVRGEPTSGYYNDLRLKAVAHRSPSAAREALAAQLADRDGLRPVEVAQLGLGAWQEAKERASWRGVAKAAAVGLAETLEPDGRLLHRFEVGHTYRTGPSWSSAMAQGQAASLFIRVALDSDEGDLLRAAVAALRPILACEADLVRMTPDGPVLQEYPTVPSSHVLNGWIFALWGLYDLACLGDAPAEDAFAAGVETLAGRLPLYALAGGWSRYDLYPHPIAHVASPFYHRLHVAQLEATQVLAGGRRFAEWIDRWSATRTWTPRVGVAVGRKVAFRLLRPRRVWHS